MPVLAVGIVASSTLVAGKVRPVLGMRLRGGPTEGARTLSYRLEAVERAGEAERAVPGLALDADVLLPGGERLGWHGTSDDEGAAQLVVVVPHPVASSVRVVVRAGQPEAVLDASVALTRAEWAAGAARRGGWVESKGSGALVVRIAAGRGAFAVPFADPLWVDARREGGRFAGIVTCECPGTEPGHPLRLVPEPGSVLPIRQVVRPLEHTTTIGVAAVDADGLTARLDTALLVVPGALRATRAPGGIRVESPIARDRAYIAVVSESERLAGGTVHLETGPDGIASGTFPVALPERERLWGVVSSEPDLRSSATVGWPLLDAEDGEPPRTFDVRDVLVADVVGARVAREVARARRARLYSSAAAVLSVVLAAALVARRARAAQRHLQSHMEASGSDAETTTRIADSGGALWTLLVAMLCLLLGALLVGLFGAFR